MTDDAPEAGRPDSRPAGGVPRPAGSLAAVILPMVLTIAILLVVAVAVSHNAAAELFATAVLTSMVLGKFAVLFPFTGGFLRTPFHVAAVVVYVDLFFAFVAVFNMGLLYRLPRFGGVLADLKRLGALVLARNPWMSRLAVLGLAACVMFPLTGTVVISAFFGEMVGLSRKRILWAIALGSVGGAVGLAALARWIEDVLGEGYRDLRDSWVFKLCGIVVIGLVIAWLTARYKRLPPRAPSDGAVADRPKTDR